jgi:hypothetical protein
MLVFFAAFIWQKAAISSERVQYRQPGLPQAGSSVPFIRKHSPSGIWPEEWDARLQLWRQQLIKVPVASQRMVAEFSRTLALGARRNKVF